MDALQLLIQERMRELRLSYREVARRGELPSSTVHHLATHGRTGRLPNPATLERLAAGLQLPLSAVRAAAASAAGVVLDSQPVGDPEIEVLVASLTQLSPADRQHVAALVRSLLTAANTAFPAGRQRPHPP
jgi:transcriptional regulator with XRE-family HTH domain